MKPGWRNAERIKCRRVSMDDLLSDVYLRKIIDGTAGCIAI